MNPDDRRTAPGPLPARPRLTRRLTAALASGVLLVAALGALGWASIPRGEQAHTLALRPPGTGQPDLTRSAKAVADQIAFRYNSSFGSGGWRIPGIGPVLSSVVCPADLRLEGGWSMTCTATSGGKAVTIPVRVTSVSATDATVVFSF
jgi:Domain of unknown function (DUF4333)